MMQNLKSNWLVVSKLIWGIWWVLTWALESPKNFHFNGLFWSKAYIFWAKKCRGVIFHDTEEWYKIWRGINLWFQNWHEKFDKFWPEHLKVSKIFTLMRSFWAKYILFELKKVQRGYLLWHWRVMQNLKRNWLVLWKLTWEIWSILTQALESLKNFHFNVLLLSKVYIVWANKVQRSYLSWHWRVIQNLERNQLAVSKLTWEIWQILTWALESLKKISL